MQTPELKKEKEGRGERTGKTVFDRDCVFVCALAGGIMRMQVLCVYVCVCCDCVFIVCFGREMSRGTCDNRVGIVSV